MLRPSTEERDSWQVGPPSKPESFLTQNASNLLSLARNLQGIPARSNRVQQLIQQILDLSGVKAIAHPTRGLQTKAIAPSNSQSAEFKQALGKHVDELERALERSTKTLSASASDPGTPDTVQKDPSLPTPRHPHPVSVAPPGSDIGTEGEALPALSTPSISQALLVNGKKTALDGVAHDSSSAKDGAAASEKSNAAAAPGIASNGLPELFVSTQAPALAASIVSGTPAPTGHLARSASSQPLTQQGVPTQGGDNKSIGSQIRQGEMTEATHESANVTGTIDVTNNPVQASGAETDGSLKDQTGHTPAISFTGIKAGQRPATAAEPQFQGVPDRAGDPGNAEQPENTSVNESRAGLSSAPQSAGSDSGTRASLDPQLIQRPHSTPSDSPSQGAARPHPSGEAAPNLSHPEGFTSTAVTHLEHATSDVSSRFGNPYQKMDQIQTPPVSLVSASTNRVAVGLHDPALGWVEIKTQSTAGQIAAALVTSSAHTHEALAAHLPSMAQFLFDREIKVSSISVQQEAVGGGSGERAASGNQGQRSNAETNAEGAGSKTVPVAPEIGFDSVAEAIGALGSLSYISIIA